MALNISSHLAEEVLNTSAVHNQGVQVRRDVWHVITDHNGVH